MLFTVASLPPSIGLCAVLGELDISGNVLTALPAELSDCAKLKALRCAGSRQKWSDRKLGKLLQPPDNPKLKPVLNHLRGGSRTGQKKEAAAKMDAVPPLRMWNGGPAEVITATISVEAVAVRSFSVICVLHLAPGVVFTEETLRAFIDAQTTIHDGPIGRRREGCGIGAHDMSTIPVASETAPTLRIDAAPPREVMLVPLKMGLEDLEPGASEVLRPASEVMAAAMAAEGRDGAASGARKYAGMLAGLPRVPVLLDSAGTVLSLPPLTNALHTLVTVATTSILVECSSTESEAVCREASLELIGRTMAIFETAEGASGSPLVLVQQVPLCNAWGQGHLRTKFPSWEELRCFDDTTTSE